MATDFAVSPRRFLTSHPAGLHDCSPNTVASYRDTFKLLIAGSVTKDRSRQATSPSTTSTPTRALTRLPGSSGNRLQG
jgi:hypothetical protein